MSLWELATPDLDQIKQGEQGCGRLARADPAIPWGTAASLAELPMTCESSKIYFAVALILIGASQVSLS